MTDSYQVSAEELRQFIERFERLEAEKRDIAEHQKEVMAEAKGRGYCVSTIKKIVSLRKQPQEKLHEQECILEIYRSAIGM
jgi:uncharacterized protein (UPF0335 family)